MMLDAVVFEKKNHFSANTTVLQISASVGLTIILTIQG